MKHSLGLVFTIAAILLFVSPESQADDFFGVRNIKPLLSPPKNRYGVWSDAKQADKKVFTPCVEVEVCTGEKTRSASTSLKIYFFDESGGIVGGPVSPSAADRTDTKTGKKQRYVVPVFYEKGIWETVYFSIPSELQGKKWKAVAVFGDQKGASAAAYPSDALFSLNYPEKELVQSQVGSKIARKPAMDPVIERVFPTGNPDQPKITLFLRPPDGITDASEIKGVLAACVLARNPDDIKRRLQALEPSQEVGGLMRFADQHKLAILCWGAQVLWNPAKNYDEIELRKAFKLDRAFDQVARAWERGVQQFHEEYGIPDRNFFLWGFCAAGQWAHRLAMRKPDYFLAVYIHIPSSFDKPTPEAAKILWLLTAGELDGGYKNSISFYQECRAAGYSIIFKPIVGLGHAGSPISNDLGLKFFEYAMSVKGERQKLDEKIAKAQSESSKLTVTEPWLAQFKEPPFYGDYLNQQAFESKDVDLIPATFRVPLPSKEIMEAWNKW
ncbi:hypothetical protein DB345_05205 [Spartobacteria bacterium LR76]|nr:hypothetical protein DB345_05205 [Spartobacteria bacterium LR76]